LKISKSLCFDFFDEIFNGSRIEKHGIVTTEGPKENKKR
jgi:hypothetical protein